MTNETRQRFFLCSDLLLCYIIISSHIIAHNSHRQNRIWLALDIECVVYQDQNTRTRMSMIRESSEGSGTAGIDRTVPSFCCPNSSFRPLNRVTSGGLHARSTPQVPNITTPDQQVGDQNNLSLFPPYVPPRPGRRLSRRGQEQRFGLAPLLPDSFDRSSSSSTVVLCPKFPKDRFHAPPEAGLPYLPNEPHLTMGPPTLAPRGRFPLNLPGNDSYRK